VSDLNDASPSPAPTVRDSSALVIPAFGKSPALSLELTGTREAERRLVEAKTVNPVTYTDLEHCFNESYRELKRHAATVGYQIALANKALEDAKAKVLLETLPEYMKDKAKSWDSSDLRKALMMKDPDYVAALDRINMLQAMEAFVDGRIKVMENVCRYMRKQMDLVIRSGLSNADLYNTQGRKNGY
jgi:hypothetical protein